MPKWDKFNLYCHKSYPTLIKIAFSGRFHLISRRSEIWLYDLILRHLDNFHKFYHQISNLYLLNGRIDSAPFLHPVRIATWHRLRLIMAGANLLYLYISLVIVLVFFLNYLLNNGNFFFD